MNIDLPITIGAALVGQPAPPLQAIKGWKNSPPLTLEELRGKVVLLEFWGHWCGPCVASMPELMKLYDEFKGQGLEVIAVHDDSAESIAEMDQKLTNTRKTLWSGRDLPFPVALDGGGESRVPYTSGTRRGKTNAAYGINEYPTTIAIGRDGRIIGSFELRSDDARERVMKLLAAEPPVGAP